MRQSNRQASPKSTKTQSADQNIWIPVWPRIGNNYIRLQQNLAGSFRQDLLHLCTELGISYYIFFSPCQLGPLLNCVEEDKRKVNNRQDMQVCLGVQQLKENAFRKNYSNLNFR